MLTTGGFVDKPLLVALKNSVGMMLGQS